MVKAEVPQPDLVVPEPHPAGLEARLEALAEGLGRLERRVALLETVRHPAEEALPSALAEPPQAVLPGATGLLGHLGRLCLALGGATFIRALVDAGALPRGWGVTLGLAYALAWTLRADRAPDRPAAGFQALASVLTVYPLLLEATVRFGILPPGAAAFLLVGATALLAAVAWRRDLEALLWTATFAALACGFALMALTRALEAFSAAFLALGIGALWLTYGRRWHGLRWPTALAADASILILALIAAWPGGPPEGYRDLPPARALALALLLAVAYLGSFALRMLQRRRVVNAFEGVQTALALLVGFGGALRIAQASGSGTALLGLGISVAGLGCCAAALPFAEDQEETRANFNFFTFLALVFLLLGGPIVLPRPLYAAACGGLGVLAALAGLRLRRSVLLLQASLALAVSAAASGLAGASLRAFLGPQGPGALPPAALASLAALGVSLLLFLFRRPPDPVALRMRPAVLLQLALAAVGLGALAVRGATAPFPPEAATLAAARTLTLAALTLGLAALGRRVPVLDLRWLVHPLLAAASLKVLVEDLAVGRPLTLFLAFMGLGSMLILSPRLLKVTR